MEVIKFKSIDRNYDYDIGGDWWSRIYEYKIVLNFIENICESEKLKIHNTSCGFGNQHKWFIEKINRHGNIITNTDIKETELSNDDVYDITNSPKKEWENYFDLVLNISTVEEVVNFDHVEIIKNLLSMVKEGGHLIITFDLPGIQLEKVEKFLNKKYTENNNCVTGYNSAYKQDKYSHLKCGYLIIKK